MHSLFVRTAAVVSALVSLLGVARAADWQPLFNGKDLAGWTGVHEVKFEARDGALRLVRGHPWPGGTKRTWEAYRGAPRAAAYGVWNSLFRRGSSAAYSPHVATQETPKVSSSGSTTA